MLFILLNYFKMKIRLPMATIFNLVGMFILFGLPASISCSSETVYAPALSSPSTGTVEEETPLSCWACNTTDENDGCFNLTEEYHSEERMQKCMPHQKYCKVERVWYIISVNKPAHNFSIYRNCTEKCEPYCLIMGDRTKIYSCATCCEESLCNEGSKANKMTSFLSLNNYFSWPLYLKFLYLVLI